MKLFIMLLAVICIFFLIILGINTIIFVKKNENKKIEDIRDKLLKKINVLEILTILIGILSILIVIINFINKNI